MPVLSGVWFFLVIGGCRSINRSAMVLALICGCTHKLALSGYLTVPPGCDASRAFIFLLCLARWRITILDFAYAMKNYEGMCLILMINITAIS